MNLKFSPPIKTENKSGKSNVTDKKVFHLKSKTTENYLKFKNFKSLDSSLSNGTYSCMLL